MSLKNIFQRKCRNVENHDVNYKSFGIPRSLIKFVEKVLQDNIYELWFKQFSYLQFSFCQYDV